MSLLRSLLKKSSGERSAAGQSKSGTCANGHSWRVIAGADCQLVRCKRCDLSYEFDHHTLWGVSSNLVCASTTHTWRPTLGEDGLPAGVQCVRCGDLWEVASSESDEQAE